MAHEINIWSRLHHDNILRFLGYITLGKEICLISPWATYKTLPEYLRNNTIRWKNRIGLVRHVQEIDVQ
jgi:hypothetical protein